VRFLVDMALAPRVAAWLVDHGHDAVHASSVGLDRAPDSDIIDRARTDDRVIVTADLDYPRLLVLARADRPGLILFRGGQHTDAQVIERLARTIETVSADELQTSLVVVEAWRIRRRRLPIQ
jgi:predicted nuclease of predicted toxin-antitoxin system